MKISSWSSKRRRIIIIGSVNWASISFCIFYNVSSYSHCWWNFSIIYCIESNLLVWVHLVIGKRRCINSLFYFTLHMLDCLFRCLVIELILIFNWKLFKKFLLSPILVEFYFFYASLWDLKKYSIALIQITNIHLNSIRCEYETWP